MKRSKWIAKHEKALAAAQRNAAQWQDRASAVMPGGGVMQIPTDDEPWAWAVFSEYDDVPCDEGTCDYAVLHDPIEAQTACDDMNEWHVDKGKAPGARVVPLVPFALVEQARADLAASQREADRLRHGVPVEGDFVCPDTLEVVELRAEVERLRAECLTVHDAGRAFENARVIVPFIAEQERSLGVLAAANDTLRAEVERCRAHLVAMVKSACFRVHGDVLDSEDYEPHADALRYLASIGKVEIVIDVGNHVIARWR